MNGFPAVTSVGVQGSQKPKFNPRHLKIGETQALVAWFFGPKQGQP